MTLFQIISKVKQIAVCYHCNRGLILLPGDRIFWRAPAVGISCRTWQRRPQGRFTIALQRYKLFYISYCFDGDFLYSYVKLPDGSHYDYIRITIVAIIVAIIFLIEFGQNWMDNP